MKYYLAIDAGGTKTKYVLADEMRELARVESGSIKRLRVGAAEAQRNLVNALGQLAVASGVSLERIAKTCVGTSGATVPLVRNWILDELQSRVGGEVTVCGDEVIALDAAFHGGRGVLVVAGTGSNAVGRSQDGRLVNAGGWGPLLADEGSGHWIGHQALRAAFRAIDEGTPSTLLSSVVEHWSLSGIAELIEMANGTPAPDFSQLTTLVAACAQAGDAVAAEVLHRGGEELAWLVVLVIRQLREQEGANDFALPAIAITGSILGQVAPVRHAMVSALGRRYAEIEVAEEPVDPVLGALWRARDLASSP